MLVYLVRCLSAACRVLYPLVFRFLGFFFGTGVSAESSRGLVLDSDVDSTRRVGVVGVVGGKFVAGVVSLSCAGISDKSLTIDSKSLIWHRWRCRSCSLSAAVGGDWRLVGSGVSWGGGVLAVSASACSIGRFARRCHACACGDARYAECCRSIWGSGSSWHLVMLSIAVRVDPLFASLSILPHVRMNATMGVCCGSAVGVLEGAMVTIMPSWRVSVSRTSLPRQSRRFQGS